MRENDRNSIASIEKFPQFTTMHVIDGQAGLIICASLIFYSLTIDNILNIIVLLILAGVSINMLSGDNSVLKKTADAKVNTENAQYKEKITIAYNSAIADGQGNITEDYLAKELTNELGGRNEKYSLYNSKDGKSWIVSVNGTDLKEVIAKPTNLQSDSINPEVEYGYSEKEGLVNASELLDGDIINYYYDEAKEPISCAVLYNDKSHGLQVIALDSVQEIILGSSEAKTIEAFANGIPNGYYEEIGIHDKARWAYNHAFQILKEYAMDYIGNMAINARCIGVPDNMISEEDESNMIVANCARWILKQKDRDDWYLCDELKKMESLGILISTSSKPYWISSRNLVYTSASEGDVARMAVRYVDSDGTINSTTYFCRWSYNIEQNKLQFRNPSNQTFGFRPLFQLRDDIKIEKTGHVN